jgi:hypothetical protein
MYDKYDFARECNTLLDKIPLNKRKECIQYFSDIHKEGEVWYIDCGNMKASEAVEYLDNIRGKFLNNTLFLERQNATLITGVPDRMKGQTFFDMQ